MKKKITVLLALIICVLSMVLLLPISSVKADGKKFDTIISENEIQYIEDKITSIENNTSEITTYSNNTKNSNKNYLLYDFNGEARYICTEFSEGGYVIFDRDTLSLYERTTLGLSPYNGIVAKKYYYGGFGNYLYKEKNYLVDINTKEKIEKKYFSKNAVNMKKVREKDKVDKDREKAYSEQLQSNASTYAFDPYQYHTHLLAENLETEDKYARAFYFYSLQEGGVYNGVDKTLHMLDMEGKEDCIFGLNKYGSCVFVAAGMLLQYYDRLGIADLVPSDALKFDEIQYDFEIDNGIEYNGYLSLSKNKFMAERLHQQLISLSFSANVVPINNNNNDKLYGYNLSKMVNTLEKYFSKMGISSPKIVHHNSDLGMEGAIGEGHPVAVGFKGIFNWKKEITDKKQKPSITETVWVESTTTPHAAVAYGYTTQMANTFIKEYIVNFGWYNQRYFSASGIEEIRHYEEVYINKNQVYERLALYD